jgi:hypothetical protein
MGSDLLVELQDILHECARANWDGFGAGPISAETYQTARRLVTALPFSVPVPQVSAEPDGEITFEWYSAPSQVSLNQRWTKQRTQRT